MHNAEKVRYAVTALLGLLATLLIVADGAVQSTRARTTPADMNSVLNDLERLLLSEEPGSDGSPSPLRRLLAFAQSDDVTLRDIHTVLQQPDGPEVEELLAAAADPNRSLAEEVHAALRGRGGLQALLLHEKAIPLLRIGLWVGVVMALLGIYAVNMRMRSQTGQVGPDDSWKAPPVPLIAPDQALSTEVQPQSASPHGP